MFIWHDFVIVGDSFCMSRKAKTDWPQLVLSGLTGEPFEDNKPVRGRGVAGGSWWKARRILNQEAFSNGRPRVIIFCHSDSARINHDGNEPYNAATMDSYPEVKSYYDHMFSPDFHKWAKVAYFRELNARWDTSLCLHFHCFDEFLDDEVQLNGLVYKKSLSSLVGEDRLKVKESGISNHMTKDQQKTFADNIIKMITENKVDNTIDIINGNSNDDPMD
ncbi:hypothetical protein N9V27_00785 [bacterium]|nr:hypothetical protein [bacterium]